MAHPIRCCLIVVVLVGTAMASDPPESDGCWRRHSRIHVRAAPMVAVDPVAPTVQPPPEPWGHLKGRVVWAPQAIPERKPIERVKDSVDKNHCLQDGPIPEETWVVNKKNRGLRWTFVWLINDDPKDKAPLPIHPSLKPIKNPEVVIDMPKCAFVPHAVGIREGQTLVFKNTSPIAHNIRFSGRNNEGSIVVPSGRLLNVRNLAAERLPLLIECNIHPWMRGGVGVFNHPYFAVTDEDGNFEIPLAPPGKFRLVVWNNVYRGGAAGRFGQPVTVEAARTLDFGALAFAPPE